MDHKEIVSEDLNWLHLARDRMQLTGCYENSDKPTLSGMFQLICCRLLQKNSAECFLLDLLLLLFTITGKLCSSKAGNNAQKPATIAVAESRFVNIVSFPGTVLCFQTHNLKVADA